MSNIITFEFCAEDRARLDRLAEALERRTCDQCVASALEAMQANQPQPTEPDPVQKALAETLNRATKAQKSPENAAGEAEVPTPATTPQKEETPKDEKPAAPATEKKVSQTDVRALYVKLSAGGKKKEAQAIILPISTTISGIPDDKVLEVYKKLSALEG